MQKSPFSLKRWEETSHVRVSSSLSLEAGRSSVRTNVKKKTFSLRQLATELREADTTLDTKEKCMNHLHFC